MNPAPPVTSVETLPTELLEWLGERKIKPGDGDLWVQKTFFSIPSSPRFYPLLLLITFSYGV